MKRSMLSFLHYLLLFKLSGKKGKTQGYDWMSDSFLVPFSFLSTVSFNLIKARVPPSLAFYLIKEKQRKGMGEEGKEGTETPIS